MARIVVVIDNRGQRRKMTEEKAAEFGFSVVGKTATAEVKTKAASKPAARKTTRRKK